MKTTQNTPDYLPPHLLKPARLAEIARVLALLEKEAFIWHGTPCPYG